MTHPELQCITCGHIGPDVDQSQCRDCDIADRLYDALRPAAPVLTEADLGPLGYVLTGDDDEILLGERLVQAAAHGTSYEDLTEDLTEVSVDHCVAVAGAREALRRTLHVLMIDGAPGGDGSLDGFGSGGAA